MGKKRIAKKGAEEPLKTPSILERQIISPEGPSIVPKELKEGKIYIYSSYNNTIMSLTDMRGNVLANVSAGSIGFEGTKKSTPFAATKVADALYQLAKQKGIGKVDVFVKGIGTGRDAALRSLAGKDIEILSIRDITPIPHNGPRPPKVRRV